MKRYLLSLLFFFSVIAWPIKYIRAANSDTWNISGQGVYNPKDMVHTDSKYNMRLYNGSIYLGDNGLVPSVDNTQVTPSITVGGYYGLKVPIKYVTGVTNGDLVCSSNTATGNALQCVTTNTTTVIGIADNTYAAGTVGWMTVAGYAVVHTSGTVSIGDLLVSSATVSAGYGGSGNSGSNGTVIGKALSVGTVGGGNTLAVISLQ